VANSVLDEGEELEMDALRDECDEDMELDSDELLILELNE